MENRFIQISKKVGYERRCGVSLPNKSRALELYRHVAEDECAEAFEEVYILYRFAPSYTTNPDYEIQRIITDAFMEGQRIFLNEPAIKELAN